LGEFFTLTRTLEKKYPDIVFIVSDNLHETAAPFVRFLMHKLGIKIEYFIDSYIYNLPDQIHYNSIKVAIGDTTSNIITRKFIHTAFLQHVNSDGEIRISSKLALLISPGNNHKQYERLFRWFYNNELEKLLKSANHHIEIPKIPSSSDAPGMRFVEAGFIITCEKYDSKIAVTVAEKDDPKFDQAIIHGKNRLEQIEVKYNRNNYENKILHDLFHIGRCKLLGSSSEEYQKYVKSLNRELDNLVRPTVEEQDISNVTSEPKKEKRVVEELLTKEDKTNLEALKKLGIIANSKAMADIYDKLVLQKDEITVLITGESGTGKELIAKALHKLSVRSQKKYETVSCATIPDTTIDSELFGHTAGAFTDAKKNHRGYFAVADGGTLFLDEIGELSDNAQKKLLRVIQEGEIRPIGSEKNEKIDVRIIAATLKNIDDKSKFREDLYYRLNRGRIHLPPLRDRVGDIPLLAAFFYERYAKKYLKTHSIKVLSIEPKFFNSLKEYNWPGNVRELESKIEKFVIFNHKHIDEIPKNKIYDIIIKEIVYKKSEEKQYITNIDYERMRLYIKNKCNLTATKKDIQRQPNAAEYKSRDTQLIKRKINNFLLALGNEYKFDPLKIADVIIKTLDLQATEKAEVINTINTHFQIILTKQSSPTKPPFDDEYRIFVENLKALSE
jgi:transcriptional regulator with GAF, ATPase, and Fis domain